MGNSTGKDNANSAGDADGKKKDAGDVQSRYLSIGIVLGISIGVAISLALDNWAFIGVGIALGVGLGVALGQQKAAPEEKGKSGADAEEPPGN
jgi:hypothetical protein